MKYAIILKIFVLFFASNAYTQLTQSDLDKIRLIVKEEVEIAIDKSEKRMKEYVDLKVKVLDGKVNQLFYFTIALIGAGIALPQILIWRQDRKNGMNKQLYQDLSSEIESLKKSIT